MTSNESPTPAAGDLVAERYRVESVIGTGGMAVVYRAMDEELGRPVALKVFRESVVDAASVTRQAEEIRLIASLDHPALVTLYDALPGGVLVMQLVEGRDLRFRIAEEGTVPAQAVAAIGADIAGALAYVHGRGVIHRDISPANVLLPEVHEGGAPIARLADFGIARLIDSAGLTQTGTVIGTASYLSPEQAEGKVLGPSTDIYSLGLTLLEALTGHRAFPGTAIESVTSRLSNDPAVPDTLVEGWRALLGAMTSRNPDARPTASDIVPTLRQLQSTVDEPTATVLMPTPTAPVATAATKLLPSADAAALAATELLPGVAAVAATEVLRQERTVSTPPPKPANGTSRRTAILIVGALALAGLIVAVVLAASTIGGVAEHTPGAASSSPTASASADPVVQKPVAPDYPTVEGKLGTSLGALQQLVGYDMLDEATAAALQQQVLALTTSAAAGDYRTALDQVETLKRSVDQSSIDDSAARSLTEAIDQVRDDLNALDKPGKGPKND